MPYRNGKSVWNETIWSDEMIQTLKDDYGTKTNRELADELSITLTVTRNKLRQLGLKRYELEYWCKEQTQFLIDNYKTMGDVEIMEIFKVRWPKKKGWVRGAIRKKRKQLGLMRTKKEIHRIASKNSSPGGRSYSIHKHSSSINMHPKWVVQQLAWRDPVMQEELLKRPDLIEAGKALIKLKRITKQKLNATKTTM